LATNHQFVYPIWAKSWRVADCLVKIDANQSNGPDGDGTKFAIGSAYEA